MTTQSWAAMILASGIWSIIVAGFIVGPPVPPRNVWVPASSDRVRSHPVLVRASGPMTVAPFGEVRAPKGR